MLKLILERLLLLLYRVISLQTWLIDIFSLGLFFTLSVLNSFRGRSIVILAEERRLQPKKSRNSKN